MSTKTVISAEEFAGMAFETPYELVRGELVEMNQPGLLHGIVCTNLAMELGRWARETSAGVVAVNDTGVRTERNPDTVRGADCLFVKNERLPAGGISAGLLSVAPDLVVEVLSPSDRWAAVLAKVGEYLEAGVAEVWVVDPAERAVQVFRGDQAPVPFTADTELTSDDVLPGFRCRVAELFRDI